VYSNNYILKTIQEVAIRGGIEQEVCFASTAVKRKMLLEEVLKKKKDMTGLP
jgi:hypothetical protein